MGAPLDLPDLSSAGWEEDTVSVWIEDLACRSWMVRNGRRGG